MRDRSEESARRATLVWECRDRPPRPLPPDPRDVSDPPDLSLFFPAVFFPGAISTGGGADDDLWLETLPCTPDCSKEGDGAAKEARPRNCAG